MLTFIKYTILYSVYIFNIEQYCGAQKDDN